jgi:hypothetical protein
VRLVARVAGHEDLASAAWRCVSVTFVRSSAPPVSATAAVSVSAPVPTGVMSM